MAKRAKGSGGSGSNVPKRPPGDSSRDAADDAEIIQLLGSIDSHLLEGLREPVPFRTPEATNVATVGGTLAPGSRPAQPPQTPQPAPEAAGTPATGPAASAVAPAPVTERHPLADLMSRLVENTSVMSRELGRQLSARQAPVGVGLHEASTPALSREDLAGLGQPAPAEPAARPFPAEGIPYAPPTPGMASESRHGLGTPFTAAPQPGIPARPTTPPAAARPTTPAGFPAAPEVAVPFPAVRSAAPTAAAPPGPAPAPKPPESSLVERLLSMFRGGLVVPPAAVGPGPAAPGRPRDPQVTPGMEAGAGPAPRKLAAVPEQLGMVGPSSERAGGGVLGGRVAEELVSVIREWLGEVRRLRTGHGAGVAPLHETAPTGGGGEKKSSASEQLTTLSASAALTRSRQRTENPLWF